MKTAVIQLSATANKSTNIKKAVEFVRQAIGVGAQFVALPEVFMFRGRIQTPYDLQTVAEPIPGDSLRPLLALAKAHKIFILAGSVYERAAGTGKAYNTSVFIDNHGTIKACYRKINLFEAVIEKKHIREADCFIPGRKLVTAQAGEFKLGMSICYDLRFPEMYRQYATLGVHVLGIPSAFTHETGKAHWEVLIRARAIENRCYVLAPNQVNKSSQGTRHYGHSMIVGPWGEIIAMASGNKEEIIFTDLNLKTIRAGAQKLPALLKKKGYNEKK